MKQFSPNLAVLPPAQQAIWKHLSHSVPTDFVLYGGTSIALRLGHRASVDFDFFSSEAFQPGELAQKLHLLGTMERIQSSANTLTVLVGSGEPVKLSFFGNLSIGRVEEPERPIETTLQCASLLDLAATKLKVVHDRAESKDYLDIVALLSCGLDLSRMLGAARALYGEVFNPTMTLKALTYFKDGDLPALPEAAKQLLVRAAADVDRITDVSRKSDRLSSS